MLTCHAIFDSLDAGYYWLLLTGQVIASLCNLFIWGAGSHLSEVWFPPSERATSTAISAGIAPNVSHECNYIFSPSPLLGIRLVMYNIH